MQSAEIASEVAAALGFAHAQDRLWQMDMMRRYGAGPKPVLLLGQERDYFDARYVESLIDLYETTGTCSDYAYGVFASVGYTFEHAGSSFHPAYASTVPAMYAIGLCPISPRTRSDSAR